MTIQRRSAAFVLLATLGIVLINIFESETRHTLNVPALVDWAVLLLLSGLGCTHLFISTVMWLQRKYWKPSEASMFRWIWCKGLLWSNIAWTFTFAGRGVRLDIAYLYVLILMTTMDMDIKMFGRFVLGWEDSKSHVWDGAERRVHLPGRRKTDAIVLDTASSTTYSD
jgi:hypothetical protein